MAAVNAPGGAKAAMKVDHVLTTSAFMQVIHVLGHDCRLRNVLSEFCYREMSCIRLRLEHFQPTPLIPTPAQPRIRTERFGCR
ncbi:hypothetical protein A3K88_07580 [Pseudomonas putida]|nr:hypothetical protein A3K88_07580 [Pseudomonas putida]